MLEFSFLIFLLKLPLIPPDERTLLLLPNFIACSRGCHAFGTGNLIINSVIGRRLRFSFFLTLKEAVILTVCDTSVYSIEADTVSGGLTMGLTLQRSSSKAQASMGWNTISLCLEKASASMQGCRTTSVILTCWLMVSGGPRCEADLRAASMSFTTSLHSGVPVKKALIGRRTCKMNRDCSHRYCGLCCVHNYVCMQHIAAIYVHTYVYTCMGTYYSKL